MKIIGITGSSGSGKTTLCEIIKNNYNAEIIDADKIAKQLSNDKNSTYFKEMVKLFGRDSLKSDGMLDRKKIASIIYTDNEKRLSLNNLTFKYVVEKMKEDMKKIKNKDLIIIDAPLLYEANVHKLCDFVIAIVAENNNKVRRICMRDGIDEDFARKRLGIQNKDEFYIKNANYVIYNNKDIKDLEEAFKKILEES